MGDVLQRLAHLVWSQRIWRSPDYLNMNYRGCGGQRQILKPALCLAVHPRAPPADTYLFPAAYLANKSDNRRRWLSDSVPVPSDQDSTTSLLTLRPSAIRFRPKSFSA